MKRYRWKCACCGKLTVGRLPKGGDGSFYYPARHTAADDEAPCPGNYEQAELVEFEGGAGATGGDAERAKPRDFFADPAIAAVEPTEAARRLLLTACEATLAGDYGESRRLTTEAKARLAEPTDVRVNRRCIGQWQVTCPFCGGMHYHLTLGQHAATCGRGSYRINDDTNHGESHKTLKKRL
jgi:hypothetical protein